jgi:5-methylcytosine-specific restriction endonuclease McrA
MAQDFARPLYNSKRWQKCRRGYISSVNGLCERCLKAGHYVPGEIVHHKIELTARNIGDENIALRWGNLELLCATCHQLHHATKYGNTAPGLKFDESGVLIQR